jgi:hypothetical protein
VIDRPGSLLAESIAAARPSGKPCNGRELPALSGSTSLDNPMADSRHPYLELLGTRLNGPAYAWLSSRYDELDAARFAVAYAGAGRRLGSATAELRAAEIERLSSAGVAVPIGWSLAELGRAALLVKVCETLAPEAQPAFITQQFKTSDNEERAALLKTLPLLPGPERYLDVAIDACRSHVQSVFEAIACENTYPARYFPEHNFNQLVLKAFFTGVAVRRIQGLAVRRSAELVRMAQAYASERRAAGRSVPADLNLVTGTPTPPFGSPGAQS